MMLVKEHKIFNIENVMLRGDEYNELLLKYINLEAELEIAENHNLSKKIIEDLEVEKKATKKKLSHLIIVHRESAKIDL